MNPFLAQNQNSLVSETSVPDQTIVKTIPPGESRRVDGLADSFYFVRANAPVRVKTNLLPERSYTIGQGKRLPSPALFKYLELWNDNDFALEIEMDYTFGEFIDRRFIVAGQEGAAIGIYDINTEIEVEDTLAAGNLVNYSGSGVGEVTFDPTPTGLRLKRKYVSISNNSATARLLLLDADENEIGSIFPSQTNEFHHTDFFTLRNTSGGAVDVKAYTAWEVNPYRTS